MITVVFNHCGKIAAGLEGKVADANTKAAFDCIAQASPPVDTGALKNSAAAIAGSAGDPTALSTWGAEYAAYVEYGTYKMAAQPFARPAAEAVQPGWIAALSKVVEG